MVTVKLLLLVIYWWSCKQANYFTVGAQFRGRRGGEVYQGHGFSEILLKYIFCTETQKCYSVNFYNNIN